MNLLLKPFVCNFFLKIEDNNKGDVNLIFGLILLYNFFVVLDLIDFDLGDA